MNLSSIERFLHSSRGLIAIALLPVITCLPASGQILFDNGTYATSADPGANARTADPGANFSMTGNVFTPTQSGTANEIEFAGLYANNNAPSDSITISLFSTSSGAPDTLIATSTLSNFSRTDTGTTMYSSDEVYLFSGSLDTPFTLIASTSYYLGISDATSPYGAFAVDQTASPGPATAGYSRSTSTGNFSGVYSASLSFVLSAPEPSTWAMLLGGLGLMSFFGLVRRGRA